MISNCRKSVLTTFAMLSLTLVVMLSGVNSAKAQAMYDAFAGGLVQSNTLSSDDLTISTFTKGETTSIFMSGIGSSDTNGYTFTDQGGYGSIAEAYGSSSPIGVGSSKDSALFTGLKFTNNTSSDIAVSTNYELYVLALAQATSALYNYNDSGYALATSKLILWDGIPHDKFTTVASIYSYALAFRGTFTYDFDLPGSYDFTLAANSTEYFGVINTASGYAVSIPEPGTIAFICSGSLVSLGVLLRRRVCRS